MTSDPASNRPIVKADGSPSGGPLREVTVTASEAGQRLDRMLAAHIPDLSRSRLKALIQSGQVTVGGATLGDPGRAVKLGETIAVRVPEPAPAEPSGEAIALNVVFEDAHLIVIDKPAGLVVHPAAGHASGTLVNALIAHCGTSLSGIGGVRRPGIVHRLDKDTSGLLVVAKTDAAHQALSAQFAAHGRDGRLQRSYRALVWGTPGQLQGLIDLPIGRHPTQRTRMAVVKLAAGRNAATRYSVERQFLDPSTGIARASRLKLDLETGRTHQIRVHLSHIGHPVLGDPVYGQGFKASARRLDPDAQAALSELGRQALHAAELGFEHPESGRRCHFHSPIPADMARLELALGAEPNQKIPAKISSKSRKR